MSEEYVHYSIFPHKVSPYGVPAAQIWENIIGHLMIISEFNVELFIEIGVLFGGLTSVIIPRLDYVPNFKYIGIDIKDEINPIVKKEVTKRANKAQFIFGDAFNKGIIEHIKDVINHSGRTYIFCDGGDKLKEIRIYQSLLKTGDVISVHDYKNDDRHSVNDEALKKETLTLKEVEPKKFRNGVFLPLFMK